MICFLSPFLFHSWLSVGKSAALQAYNIPWIPFSSRCSINPNNDNSICTMQIPCCTETSLLCHTQRGAHCCWHEATCVLNAFRVAAVPCMFSVVCIGREESPVSLCVHTPLLGMELPVISDFSERALSNLTWFFLALNLSLLGLTDKPTNRCHSILIVTLPLQYQWCYWTQKVPDSLFSCNSYFPGGLPSHKDLPLVDLSS